MSQNLILESCFVVSNIHRHTHTPPPPPITPIHIAAPFPLLGHSRVGRRRSIWSQPFHHSSHSTLVECLRRGRKEGVRRTITPTPTQNLLARLLTPTLPPPTSNLQPPTSNLQPPNSNHPLTLPPGTPEGEGAAPFGASPSTTPATPPSWSA